MRPSEKKKKRRRRKRRIGEENKWYERKKWKKSKLWPEPGRQRKRSLYYAKHVLASGFMAAVSLYPTTTLPAYILFVKPWFASSQEWHSCFCANSTWRRDYSLLCCSFGHVMLGMVYWYVYTYICLYVWVHHKQRCNTVYILSWAENSISKQRTSFIWRD